MSGNLTFSLLYKAAAPPIALIAIGVAWIYWGRGIKAIPATLLSIGLGLFALMLLIVVAYSFANTQALKESFVFIAGVPLLIYGGALVALLQRASISTAKGVAWGLVGLIPLYFVGGFVLIYSTCSFGAGGC